MKSGVGDQCNFYATKYSHSTVARWVKSIHENGSTRAADARTPEQQRILELERENRQLRMEVDVLKQAALIFARK